MLERQIEQLDQEPYNDHPLDYNDIVILTSSKSEKQLKQTLEISLPPQLESFREEHSPEKILKDTDSLEAYRIMELSSPDQDELLVSAIFEYLMQDVYNLQIPKREVDRPLTRNIIESFEFDPQVIKEYVDEIREEVFKNENRFVQKILTPVYRDPL